MTSSAPSSTPDLMYSCTRLYCFVLANGPRVTSLSLGSPILIFSTAALANRFTSSRRSSGTIRRDAAMPRCRDAGLSVVQGVLGDELSDLRRTGKGDFLNVGALR